MRQPSDTTDEGTLEDLLWDLDITTVNPEPQAGARPKAVTTATATPPVEPAKAPERVKAAKPAKASKRGRFHRPELESRWERLSHNRAAQAVGGTVLLGGTAALVVVALSR